MYFVTSATGRLTYKCDAQVSTNPWPYSVDKLVPLQDIKKKTNKHQYALFYADTR